VWGPKVSALLPSFVLHESRPRILDLSRRMKQAGLTTSLDTNDGSEDRWAEDLLDTLKKVDVFLLNDYKVRRIARTKDLHLAMAKLCDRIPVLAVRMRSEGATAQRGGERARGSNDATTLPGQGQPYRALGL